MTDATPQPDPNAAATPDTDEHNDSAEPEPSDGDGGGTAEPTTPPLAFPGFVEFAERWLFPNIEVRITGTNREGTYSWCPRWWAHPSVVTRIAALHKAYETARVNDDDTAMSAYFIQHIDPTVRVLLDGVNGPMHNCRHEHHSPEGPLRHEHVPPGWFARIGSSSHQDTRGPAFRQ